MRVITEELSGEHSFRGLGFLKIDGMFTAVCGSKRVNFGRKAHVSWLDEQLKRVPPEKEFVAVFSGILGSTTQGFILDADTGRTLLAEDSLYGIPRGLCEPINTTMVPMAPLYMYTNDGAAATDNAAQAWDKPSYAGSLFYITLRECL